MIACSALTHVLDHGDSNLGGQPSIGHPDRSRSRESIRSDIAGAVLMFLTVRLQRNGNSAPICCTIDGERERDQECVVNSRGERMHGQDDAFGMSS
jgi:hypothetical protein